MQSHPNKWIFIFLVAFFWNQYFTCSIAALVVFDFAGQPGNQVQTLGTTTSPDISPVPLSRGSGLGSPSGANSFNTNQWHDLGSGDYVSFGVQIRDGWSAALTNVRFVAVSSSTGPGRLTLRWNGDGYQNALHQWSQSAAAATTVEANLSSIGAVSGLVEFRIMAAGNVSAGGGVIGSTGTWRVGTNTQPGVSNLLAIDGTLASLATVPEPSSIWLVASLVPCLSILRCRWPIRIPALQPTRQP